ncbi:hypothetical protein FF1_034210 [Malus domestica]
MSCGRMGPDNWLEERFEDGELDEVLEVGGDGTGEQVGGEVKGLEVGAEQLVMKGEMEPRRERLVLESL